MKRRLLLPMLLVAASFLVGGFLCVIGTDSPSRFETDVRWWQGRVAKNFKWLDGDQDILSDDGHYVVVDWPDTLEPGETFFLLHARNREGQQRTFFCLKQNRESCGPLSLAINPPFNANTLNQGFVPESSRESNQIGRGGPVDENSEKILSMGHFVKKGERS